MSTGPGPGDQGYVTALFTKYTLGGKPVFMAREKLKVTVTVPGPAGLGETIMLETIGGPDVSRLPVTKAAY